MGNQINHRKHGLTVVAGVMLAMLALAASAFADAHNGITPANVYFGRVVSGQHPKRMVTVRNPRSFGMPILIRRFTVAGSGGQKFTLVAKDGQGRAATCHIGSILSPGQTCTLVYRVKTTRPEYWQSVVDVWYSDENGGAILGQINGGVYAHVVAGGSTAARSTQPGACSSITTMSEACS